MQKAIGLKIVRGQRGQPARCPALSGLDPCAMPRSSQSFAIKMEAAVPLRHPSERAL